MKTTIIVIGVTGLLLAVGFVACNMNLTEDDLEGIIEACDGMTLEELMTTNTISDECRDAINGLLPSDEDNLTGSVVAAGSGEVGGDRVLLIVGADASGAPLDLASAEVMVEADGEVVPESSYTIDLAANLDGTIVSSACALD